MGYDSREALKSRSSKKAGVAGLLFSAALTGSAFAEDAYDKCARDVMARDPDVTSQIQMQHQYCSKDAKPVPELTDTGYGIKIHLEKSSGDPRRDANCEIAMNNVLKLIADRCLRYRTSQR